MTSAPPLLHVDHVSVSFDGFRALDDLSLSFDKGELRCLIGPNGAGKTTLMDVITGRTRPDVGRVTFEGEDLARRSEHQIVALGIGRKLQRPTVFPEHTVFENMELASHGSRGVFRALFARLPARTREAIDETLEQIGLAGASGVLAGTLSHGQKQWLEMGMLLVQKPKLLLVDEPIAGMTPQETERTAEILASLAGEHTVVVVEHDMAFVRSIAKTVTVLHEGRVLAEGPMADVSSDPRVVEVYLGA